MTTIILSISVPILVITGLIFGYKYFKKRRQRQDSKQENDADGRFIRSHNDNEGDNDIDNNCNECRDDYLEHYNEQMQNTFGFQMSVDETYESGFRGMYEV